MGSGTSSIRYLRSAPGGGRRACRSSGSTSRTRPTECGRCASEPRLIGASCRARISTSSPTRSGRRWKSAPLTSSATPSLAAVRATPSSGLGTAAGMPLQRVAEPHRVGDHVEAARSRGDSDAPEVVGPGVVRRHRDGLVLHQDVVAHRVDRAEDDVPVVALCRERIGGLLERVVLGPHVHLEAQQHLHARRSPGCAPPRRSARAAAAGPRVSSERRGRGSPRAPRRGGSCAR